MYPNFHSEQYPHNYTNDIYNFRQLANQVGTFITILNNIPIAGGTIPAGTRVFIHRVVVDAGGNEIVTIVFPQTGAGGNCIARSTTVFGSVLTAPAPVQQLRFSNQYY
ncbi:hypothetical protein [Priestia endophytica]|uniref:hypothetical protein n=1 Tax=Priestia endophytica TaxID=135735 RepID=UPI00124F501F|nr:hypothetical protein [Priestia endophytica]KAB2486532.1 hypothetical protein F8155_26705 [Priestia endophytica]